MAEAFLHLTEFLKHCYTIPISDEEDVDHVQDNDEISADLLSPESMEPLPGIFDAFCDVIESAHDLSGDASPLSTPNASPVLHVLQDSRVPPTVAIKQERTIGTPHVDYDNSNNADEKNRNNCKDDVDEPSAYSTISPETFQRFFVQQIPTDLKMKPAVQAERSSPYNFQPTRSIAPRNVPTMLVHHFPRTSAVNPVPTHRSFEPTLPAPVCFDLQRPNPVQPIQMTAPYQPSRLFGQPQILLPSSAATLSVIRNSDFQNFGHNNFSPLSSMNDILRGRGNFSSVNINEFDKQSGLYSMAGPHDRRRKLPYEFSEPVQPKVLRRSYSAPTDSQRDFLKSLATGQNLPPSTSDWTRSCSVDSSNNISSAIDLNSAWVPSPSGSSATVSPEGSDYFNRREHTDTRDEQYVREIVSEREREKAKRSEYSSKNRSRLQNAMHSLKTMVPGLSSRASQSTVLEYTISYIRFLREHVRSDLDKEFEIEMTRIERQNWNPDITRRFEETSA